MMARESLHRATGYLPLSADSKPVTRLLPV
jgi:hypothetical protein